MHAYANISGVRDKCFVASRVLILYLTGEQQCNIKCVGVNVSILAALQIRAIGIPYMELLRSIELDST